MKYCLLVLVNSLKIVYGGGGEHAGTIILVIQT